MNLGLALARIAIDEAEKAARASSDPHRAWAYSVQREQDQRDARSRAAVQKLHDKYMAKRAMSLATVATSGKGWRVLAAPRTSHDALERLVRNTWDLAFHGTPWPHGWKARWADLSAANARGMCVLESKLILLDEAVQRRRTPREFLTTVVHELAHLQHPDEIHGPGHADTLQRLVDFVLGEPDAVGAEPRKGLPFSGRPVMAADAGQWEYR